jgi:hypothetical protein
MLHVTLVVLMVLSATGSAIASENSPTVVPTEVGSALTSAAMPNPVEMKRPSPLPALYVSFAGLQALDTVTTSAALARGAREINPALSRGNRATVWAVKAATR